jgi:hypothetical protein
MAVTSDHSLRLEKLRLKAETLGAFDPSQPAGFGGIAIIFQSGDVDTGEYRMDLAELARQDLKGWPVAGLMLVFNNCMGDCPPLDSAGRCSKCGDEAVPDWLKKRGESPKRGPEAVNVKEYKGGPETSPFASG